MQLENNIFIAKSRSYAAQVESAPGNVKEKILKAFIHVSIANTFLYKGVCVDKRLPHFLGMIK